MRDAQTLQWLYLTPAFEEIYGFTRNEALEGDNFDKWLNLILEEDRGRVLEAVDRVRSGEHVTFDYRIRRPHDASVRWLRNTDFPITDGDGRIKLIGGVGHDLTELHETELRLQVLMEGIPQLVWRADNSGAWTWSSPQWTEFTGLTAEESKGDGWLKAFHPEDRDRAREAWAEAAETNKFEVEARIRHKAEQEYRWFQTRAAPVRNESGVIIEWLGTSTDIHQLHDLQARQQVLVAELQHRTRNLMAVVLSASDKTLQSSADLADFRLRFRTRLEALSRVQAVLSRLSEPDRVTFDQLLNSELEALGGVGNEIGAEGPSGIRLRSSTVQTLAMAIHELATNALKYGALSQPSAKLEIRWRLETEVEDDSPWLHIDWRETGVTMPADLSASIRGGHGRELIERALPYQLDAKTTFAFTPEGVHCTISLPVSNS